MVSIRKMMSTKKHKRPTELLIFATLLILFLPAIFYTIIFNYPDICISDDPGVPLFLTPLIEQNQTDDARMASEVYFNGFRKHVSFSGYFTVDKPYNSNLFFWFFPSQDDFKKNPLILWLQGDLGASSLLGLFEENGPFSVKVQHGLKEREQSWTKNNSVLYIDSPVGSGYSFTDGGYAQNQSTIVKHLYNALGQFFKVFPELQNNEIFIAGAGYACQTMAVLADKIHQNNLNLTTKINLTGLMIQNGFCDPINQIIYSDYLYQTGLIDINAQTQLKTLENQVVNNIKNKNYDAALKLFNSILNTNDSFVQNCTGFQDYDNLLYPLSAYTTERNLVLEYIQRNDVRAALHVGNQPFFNNNINITENLKAEVLQSVSSIISNLLQYYKILLYSGQLDVAVPYSSVENFLRNLNFSGLEEYKSAKRNFWRVDEYLAGYYKQVENLTELFVRSSGHLTTADQPVWIFDLIHRFTRNLLPN